MGRVPHQREKRVVENGACDHLRNLADRGWRAELFDESLVAGRGLVSPKAFTTQIEERVFRRVLVVGRADDAKVAAESVAQGRGGRDQVFGQDALCDQIHDREQHGRLVRALVVAHHAGVEVVEQFS